MNFFEKAIDSLSELTPCFATIAAVKKCKEDAITCFREAAEQGNSVVQYILANCYAKGRWVDKDEELAASWFCKAADQGNADAQHDLGMYYEYGTGVVKDYSAALKWHLKAAEQGHLGSQYKLSEFYGKGMGVAMDEKEAKRWRDSATLQENVQRNIARQWARENDPNYDWENEPRHNNDDDDEMAREGRGYTDDLGEFHYLFESGENAEMAWANTH